MVDENVPGPLPANILPFGASTCTSTLVMPVLVQVMVVCLSPCEFGVNGFGFALIEPVAPDAFMAERAAKFAVYVVAVVGVTIVWFMAPPSDQETKSYVTPFTVCGVSTPRVRGRFQMLQN